MNTNTLVTFTDADIEAFNQAEIAAASNALPEHIAALPTTSAKIRAMAAEGYSRGAIAKKLDIRYQHVRNVLITELKKKA